MDRETFLVTGAAGCIGAWVLRHLVDDGDRIVAADLSDDPARPKLLLSADERAGITWLTLDVTDAAAVAAAVAGHGVTRIIHLAGLQVPFCKADPPRGAAVNVAGTVNVFEAARHNGVVGLSYASSVAAFGPPGLYGAGPIGDDAATAPATLYGVYKVANEATARLYWQDWRVASVGLRPCIVYGVGRDQGLSSDIAKAILAVAAERPFHIRFDGPVALQHAGDVARMFIAGARPDHAGATVCNIRNDVVAVADFIARLQERYPQARITCAADTPLPFPADLDDANLRRLLGTVPHTPLAEAVDRDIGRYRSLIAEGRIDLAQLER